MGVDKDIVENKPLISSKSILEKPNSKFVCELPVSWDTNRVLVWAASVLGLLFLIVLLHYDPDGRKNLSTCENVSHERKFDCYPRGVANQKECEARGCCWAPIPTINGKKGIKIPWCFYPTNFASYKLINRTRYVRGETLLFNLTRQSIYPKDVKTIKISILYETENQLRIRITDNDTARYEPPYPEVPVRCPNLSYTGHTYESSYSKVPVNCPNLIDTDYTVLIDDHDFGFAVVRKSTGTVIFDTRNVGGFIFSDQFLQLSAVLPSKYVYGLGEQRNNFILNTDWNGITLFNHDSPPVDNKNLYSSHPFYLAMEEDGNSHGIFLLNSNAMDIILQPAPAITYRTIGGIFDFFFFLGPSPPDAVGQYYEVIGRPFLPPYWSLGFHLCKFGLRTLNDTIEFWNRNRKIGLPFDVQWNDIDYMENRNDFTINEHFSKLKDFVNDVHNVGMKYIVILDPGVSSREPPGSYPPYDEGIIQRIFIKNSSNLPLEGRVWNTKGGTVFPDFTDPKATPYWLEMITKLHEKIPFDGLWLDMNDISNFVDGSLYGCGLQNNTLDNPPYVPNVDGGHLNYKTICMSAKEYAGSHYDVHNLYGFAESVTTNFCLSTVRGKRPFVLSRSTFAGSGHFVAHWTGDVFSTWDDMKHSVGDIISFNMFGIPMVGADICGFNYNTTEQLCQRWSQVGAFYPFSRNHNSDDTIDQDPAVFSNSMIESTKKALNFRYKLLPYLYTLFWNAHQYGESVIRPLFFEFPTDIETYKQNTQFFWGPALLIVPVLTENATTVTSYFPKSIWFDAYTLECHQSEGDYITISAPLDKIPLFFRAGFIIPFQEPALTTRDSRNNPFGLYIALDEDNLARGLLYWDDGDSLLSDQKYNTIQFSCSSSTISTVVSQWGYNVTMILDTIHVMGILEDVKHVLINNRNHTDFEYVIDKQVLSIRHASINLQSSFCVTWADKCLP